MTGGQTTRKEVAAFLANPRIHQSVTLNAGPKYGEIDVGFAEYGCQQDPSGADTPTVLFTPGMFGSRYLGAFMHVFGEKHGVRILVLDRFGFGKTPNVALEDRIDTYVAVVPKFLESLGVKHVALLSHSAGTIFNLNLLWHCRQILDPVHPQIFFFAPFVDGACSKAPMISALQALPAFSFTAWNKLANFFVTKASVVTGASSGLLINLTRAIAPGTNEPSKSEKNMKTIEAKYGCSVEFQDQLGEAMAQVMFGEETVGANREALNCLKKGPEGLWGEAEDMRLLVSKLAAREKETQRQSQEKLLVRIFFAESDVMTGKQGRDYFESCWTGQEGGCSREEFFNVKATKAEGSDHDSVLQVAESLEELFLSVSAENK